jgi:hypothetical protein
VAWNLPIMRAAVELLEHALEHAVAGEERDRRIAVLHLAQVIELGAKAALVSRNIPIYAKGSTTLTVHQSLDEVEKLRGDRLPARARVELLVDERNAIQHRYGALDAETLEYHVESVLTLFGAILDEFFDTDLHQFIRDTFDEGVWSQVPYVRTQTQDQIEAAEGELQTNPRTAFIDAFTSFELVVRHNIHTLRAVAEPLSSLDVTMKFLANWGGQDCGHLLTETPKVYKLRNSVIHGARQLEEAEALDAVRTIRALVDLLTDPASRPAFDGAVDESLKAYRAKNPGLGSKASSTESGSDCEPGDSVDAQGPADASV